MPLIQLNLRPVPLDLNKEYLNVTSDEITKKIKQFNLKAIFLTNILGHCGDMHQIRKVCKKNNIFLFEDNCESLGTVTDKKKLGTFGQMSSSSFYVAHHISTIEGGMVITNNQKYEQQLRLVRANGWDRNLNEVEKVRLRKKFNIKSNFKAKYTFYDLAYNLRPTEITGFLGLEQMKKIKKIIDKREKNFFIISKILNKKKDVCKIKVSHIKKLSSFAIPVIFKNNRLRETYKKIFNKFKIEIRPLIAGNIENQPFFRKYINKKFKLPNTKFIDECGLYFGNYPQITKNQMNIIKNCLSFIK